ncbi:phosphatidylinositol phosphatase PTPRQ-like [Amphiura filiformis]|uniref:phosphatidylinositol phosphatase PTPRQ-like n=1 Tax=Amphiura filiformis TaxID=82378 RepID=UPI003B22487C
MDNPCVLHEPVVLSYVYRLLQFSNNIVITGEVEAVEDGLTTIQILNVECDTTYELSIDAKTAVGVGPETVFTFSTERSPNPFSPGSSLMIRKVSSSTTVVSWRDSLSVCPSTDFVVEYRLLNLEQCQVQLLDTSTRISTRESEIMLNNLNGGSTYMVSVTGQTSSGVDAVLEETWTTPDSVPQLRPTDIGIVYYNPFDLVLEWSAPPCGTRGGVICYEYELVTVSDLTVIRGTTTVPRIQIIPPSGYVNYLFRVATKNSVGLVYSNNINVVPQIIDDDGLCPDRFCLNGGTSYSDNGECFCR